MNPLKKTITTLLALGLVASFVGTMISMPQMIGSAYGQSERGSERACKELPGATLERGQCEAPAKETTTFTCQKVFGQTPTTTTETCTADTTVKNGQPVKDAEADCKAAKGTSTTEKGTEPGTTKVTCKYPATKTVTLTCSNPDIKPIDGKCITKPGDRSEEEV